MIVSGESPYESSPPADPARRRAIWSWALYDFANSAFTTLVVTFIYATYFTQAIAADEITGTALWSRGVTITALIVALCSPVLGAIADVGGYRKPLVVLSTLICVAATAALYDVLPGEVLAALVLFVIANVAYEFGTVFYNAFLPDLAPEGRIGTLSGAAWGLGYLGGLLALAAALVMLVQPDVPWFGFSTEAGENIRATNLLVAVWFLVFSVPFFLWVPEGRPRRPVTAELVRGAFKQLGNTFREVRKHRQTFRFLVARLVYNDGLVTVFAFGGIYAAGTFGFSFEDVLLFGIAINVTAGLGAAALGWLDDKIGGKRTIAISLVGLIVATAIALLAPNAAWFWAAGLLIGIFTGPNQSASRSLLGRFVPPDKQNEFFGFFAFSGKLTAFIGPFLLGEATRWSGSQRVGVSVVLVLFLVGLVLLAPVDEREGIRARDA